MANSVNWTCHLDEDEVACILVGLHSFRPTDGPEAERIINTLRLKFRRKLSKMNAVRLTKLVEAGAVAESFKDAA